MTPEQLVLEVKNLFTLPEIYLKVRATIDDPKSTVEDVAIIVAQDPNISARILRIVNSSFFGFATEIHSISRAINIMGFSQVHDLVLTIATVNTFKGMKSHLINMKDYWLHSVFCAAIAKLLARKCNIVDSERLFVSGILHDIGHLVIYSKLPSHAEKLLQRAKKEQRPLAELEREVFGFDYAEVGGELLRLWKLPDCFHKTIYQHTNVVPDQAFALESAIIQLSNIVALREESIKTGLAVPKVDCFSFQVTETNEEDLAYLKVEAKKNMADILKLLFTK